MFRVYGTDKIKPPTALKLVPGSDPGSVRLVAVNEDGKQHRCGHILVIRTDGTLYLNQGVNEDLGLQLDSSGQIKLHGK